jgi:transposase InsO family protein
VRRIQRPEAVRFIRGNRDGVYARRRALGKGFVSLAQLRDHLLGTVTLPVRRTLHRRHLSAPWAVKVSHKGWTCSAHPCHYPLTIQDDATRCVLCMDGYDSIDAIGVNASFRRVFREYGVSDRIHSDNGSPFASTGIGRLLRVSVQLIRQGTEVSRSCVGHLPDDPRHEWMHRTLKTQAAQPLSNTARAQQRRLTNFVRWMNEERWHKGIGMRAVRDRISRHPLIFINGPRARGN